MSYFESQGVPMPKGKVWVSTICQFHGGRQTMRIHKVSGSWKCMSCMEGGGDVLAYHMKRNGLEFIEAAKALGAWVEDGKPAIQRKPTSLPPIKALQVLAVESNLIAIAGHNVHNGVVLTESDLRRVRVAARRIDQIQKEFQ
ncbi:CHC2 zinc finger domain-containing protein [Rhodoferax sp. GW822-FHT02A01]|uniref:CHC2 zinc finger domain-containing protein n=1 Tax=Rhodoferax sp. GW822-FHT02A01 TaxID=3141537 RepID=UPI00315CDD0B